MLNTCYIIILLDRINVEYISCYIKVLFTAVKQYAMAVPCSTLYDQYTRTYNYRYSIQTHYTITIVTRNLVDKFHIEKTCLTQQYLCSRNVVCPPLPSDTFQRVNSRHPLIDTKHMHIKRLRMYLPSLMLNGYNEHPHYIHQVE